MWLLSKALIFKMSFLTGGGDGEEKAKWEYQTSGYLQRQGLEPKGRGRGAVATTSLSKSVWSEAEIRNEGMKMDMCGIQVLFFYLLWSPQTFAAGHYVCLSGDTRSRG